MTVAGVIRAKVQPAVWFFYLLQLLLLTPIAAAAAADAVARQHQ